MTIGAWLAVTVLGAAVACAEPEETGEAGAAADPVAVLMHRFRGVQPEPRLSAVLNFYREHVPDAVTELEDRCRHDPDLARQCLERMCERFAVFDELRRRDQQDYERMLEIERLDARGRRIGRELVRLLDAAETNAAKKRAAELRQVLDRTFSAAQQVHLIELNRLEAEIRELRRLLEYRERNRPLIIERRFYELTAETEMVEDTPRADGTAREPQL